MEWGVLAAVNLSKDVWETERRGEGSRREPGSVRLGRLLGKLPYLGLLGFFEHLERWWPPFAAFALFYLFFLLFLVQLLVQPLIGLMAGRHEEKRDAGRTAGMPQDPRTPTGVAARYVLASFLSLLNPFTLLQSLLHAFGQLVVVVRLRGQPPSPGTRVAEGYRPPFRGTWIVARGGVDPDSSHSWEILNQRYAYDFYVTDEGGRSYRGTGERLEDYYAFGQEVVAPKDGVVVAVRDGVRDFPYAGRGWIDFLTRDFRGNWVTIRHGPGEHSFIAHLRPGSLRVRPGQPVRAGEVLGLCGNSGHSTEPHIHFHVQDGPNFYFAAGLPVRFGEAFLKTGDRVRGFDRTEEGGAPERR